ncbi:MAG: phosphoadenylyl-sulfate reductase [Bernardetiaceae bacterium]
MTIIESLHSLYQPLSPVERLQKAYHDYADQILYTCSFGTTAVFLLDLMAEADIRPTVHFIDTGYHFAETQAYKERLTTYYGLRIIDLHPDPDLHQQTQQTQLWQTHPDTCCAVNKVNPLQGIQSQYQIWLSGLMNWQTPHRQGLKIFSEQAELLKFCPIIDVSPEVLRQHLRTKKLPLHPLQAKGYQSIGCVHCTQPGQGRTGRWTQTAQKMECGLHTS